MQFWKSLNTLTVSTLPIGKSTLKKELTKLGITGNLTEYATAVQISSATAQDLMKNVYKINYNSRVSSRVMVNLLSGEVDDSRALYALASRIPWSTLIPNNKTFVISSTMVGSTSAFNNTMYVSQVVKDAIADSITAGNFDAIRVLICKNVEVALM